MALEWPPSCLRLSLQRLSRKVHPVEWNPLSVHFDLIGFFFIFLFFFFFVEISRNALLPVTKWCHVEKLIHSEALYLPRDRETQKEYSLRNLCGSTGPRDGLRTGLVWLHLLVTSTTAFQDDNMFRVFVTTERGSTVPVRICRKPICIRTYYLIWCYWMTDSQSVGSCPLGYFSVSRLIEYLERKYFDYYVSQLRKSTCLSHWPGMQTRIRGATGSYTKQYQVALTTQVMDKRSVCKENVHWSAGGVYAC